MIDGNSVSCAVPLVQPPPSKRQDTRRDRTESVASDVSDPEEYKNLALLKMEQEKEKPTIKTICQLMKSTYEGVLQCIRKVCMSVLKSYFGLTYTGRRQWILSQSPCIETLLKEFSSLKKIRFVSLRNVHSHIMALCVTHIGGAVIMH